MAEDLMKIPKKPFGFLFFVSKPYKLVAFLAMTSVIFASSTGSLVPYVFKRIIDSVNGISGFGPESVPFWALFYVLLSFLNGMFWRASGYSGMRWATGVRATAREKLTEYVTRHGYDFFANRFAGSIGSKLGNASDGVKDMTEDIMWGWTGFLVKFTISLFLVLQANVYIGVIFIAWLLFITPINVFLVKKKIPLGVAAQERETELRAKTVDVLTNINAVHDYARGFFEIAKIKELINIRRKAGLKNWMFTENMLSFNTVLEAVFVFGMIFTSIYNWNTGLITAGDIILILVIVADVRDHLAFLGQRFNDFAENISTVKEGLAEILLPYEVKDIPDAIDLKVSSGEIKFENVLFKYGIRNIFEDLNLEIRPGQRVGLVGRSGAGKSTLMKILTRQYDIQGGKIFIDGQDISGVNQESLRGSIAIVPQDPLLFHRSLKDNILYGNLSASDEEIINSAKHAQAHQFIDALPDKYDTLVGERGIKLSGGERQRVAIARAFLKNAKVLLLDEATSSLDSESEVAVQNALKLLMEGKTVIAIAHRLSTLKAMDRILVLDNGKIVEDGTHDELLTKGGIYSELWAHQAGGFIKED